MTVPRLRQLPLGAGWGLSALQRQKAALVEIGFAMKTDEHAAEMFAWLWITGVVHLVAGVMSLPMIAYGYDRIGPTGHLVFFTSTWLVLGWCLFDAADETLRCWGRRSTGLSGMSCPCPRNFWATTFLMHHPFWFALVLPMNAMLADLPAYHLLYGASVLGAGLQLTLRQAALVMGALGRSTAGVHKCATYLHAAVVIVSRGALFFPLVFDIAGHLFEVEGGRSSSTMFIGPALLFGCINVMMILDAIKDTMFCSAPVPPDTQAVRPLRAAETPGVDDSPKLPRTAGPDAELPGGPPRRGKGDRSRKKKKKGRRSDDIENGGAGDEEMTFGFEEDDYNDDADDDASVIGEGPAATFHARRKRDAGRDLSPNGLKDQPRYNGAGRMPPSSRSSRAANAGCGCGGGMDHTDTQSSRARADEFANEKERLRRELEDARREMDRQQHARRSGRAASDAWGTGAPKAPAPAAPTVVDHAAIFASGVLPARRNHYSMLGVSRSAGSDEIKKAFNKLAMKWHPDKNPSEVTKAEVVFMGIKDAYECLIDPIKRRRYDRNGA